MEIYRAKVQFRRCSEYFGEYGVLAVVKELQQKQFCSIRKLPFCVHFPIQRRIREIVCLRYYRRGLVGTSLFKGDCWH